MKNHPRPGKILYVEKNDFKLTKNRFFGYEILTTFRKSHFSTMKKENNYSTNNIAKKTLKTPCYDVLIFFRRLC